MLKHSGMPSNEDGLLLSGYQKKLKTMKRKFFVLYRETGNNPARLEYYDNERKFKSGLAPKRVIKIKHCFNINRRLDTKYEYVIALSTKDGGFGIVLESEGDMLKWLELLISLQRSDANLSDTFRPHFEHVWQVVVQRKGLAEEKGILGTYHVCLTPKSVTLIRIGLEKTTSGYPRISNIEILLTTIRRCGDSQCFFYMEVGRQSIIGPGELWMETEDSLIAQNMHHMILSAMSSKADLNMEPMRKRSSSANEASKPISVLQRRQTQPENKINNSPQTTIICYGRERCDSLPSRNRTSSECTNSSFPGSTILSIRNSTISGLRPHSYQRHSNSPPTNSTIGCSESEESSISIDEPDDNGSFLSYRFNSRSSEGVIPEENTDELISSEIKCNEHNNEMDIDQNTFKVPDNIGENYVSMAPVRNVSNLQEKNKLNQCKYTNSIDESICVPFLLNQGSPRSNIEFPEYTSDKVNKTFSAEVDAQFERPIRAYSIGSKIEHNKVNKRIGNTSEGDQSTIRVRAFSVGSRSKIPRCDLQRGVLLPKTTMEQNFISNNNISGLSDTIACNQLLSINACRDKKSTSAPLLIHKSHNSVDRMSDLMEIDFSKRSNHSNNRINQKTKSTTQFSKSVPSTNRDASIEFNTTKTPVSREDDFMVKHHTCVATLPIKSFAKTDNGYLEMKPIGSSFSKPEKTSSASNEYLEIKPKKVDSFDVPENRNPLMLNSNCTVLPTLNDCKKNTRCNVIPPDYSPKLINIPQPKIIEDIKDASPLTSSSSVQKLKSETNSNKNASNTEGTKPYASAKQYQKSHTYNLSSKYSELSLNPVSKEGSPILNKDNYINIGAKFNLKSNIKKAKARLQKKECQDSIKLGQTNCNEGEEPSYEILQIKSDSALQSLKPTNRSTVMRKEKQQSQLIQNRPRSTNSSSLMSASSTLSGQTSSSTSCLNYLPMPVPQTISKDRNLSANNVKTNLNVTSRPSSISSEHELYYARLDLPQCSSETNAKPIKPETSSDSSPVAVSHVNNSYAKIDFEHSDSSSSSSKNVIV